MARYLAWRLFLARNAAKPELPYVTTRVLITELQGLNKWNRKDSKERALPIVPLSSNKRANTQNHMHASLLNSLDELHYIIPSTKIVLQTKQQYRISISKKIDDGHRAKLSIIELLAKPFQEKAHGHSRTHKTLLRCSLLLLLFEQVMATSAIKNLLLSATKFLKERHFTTQTHMQWKAYFIRLNVQTKKKEQSKQ